MRCIKMSNSGENEESCIPCFSLSSKKDRGSEMEEDPLEKVMGLIRIHIKQGINLVICDVKSSDPYVVLHLGNQKVKTRIIKKSLNPEWNEDLTLCIKDPNERIKVFVYDHDTFTADDKMGDAEIDIEPFLAVVNMNLENLQNGSIVTKVTPNSQNCLAEESCIICMDGKPIQNMFLRLRNVPCGEIGLQLQWVDVRRP